MSAVMQKLSLLKECGQDFEWYPTTDEMITAVFSNCGDIGSMLDIGAGDGRVLERIDKLAFQRAERDQHNRCFRSTVDKYAIEKAAVHIENMPPDISIVGTDFVLQTLIDKKVDMVFCNPPYSEYEGWATKIIKEANAKMIFLIIPERWKGCKLIEQAIKQRGASSRVVWAGDFSDADRQARAKVEIVKITITTTDNDYKREETSPFDVWFDEYFAGFGRLNPVDDDHEDEPEQADPMHEVVEGQNLIERLANLYTHEMNSLLTNYKNLSQLDAVLLKEIGVSVDEIKNALKLKIEGVKNKYWKELFDHLGKITSRLTSKSRSSMLDKLHASCNVDFSVDNAYAVVLWAIKNANKYIDEQLVEVFKELSEPECVKNYVSNQRTWEKEGWRYKKNHTRYMLEYRIITRRIAAIEKTDGGWGYSWTNGLARDCHAFINDIFTIANNLGFGNIATSYNRQWESNTMQEFHRDGKILVTIRAFKNGNLHLKFDQEFIKTLNVEASRLLGWIKTPQEGADEMGLSLEFVQSRFRSNLLFDISEGRKLLTA